MDGWMDGWTPIVELYKSCFYKKHKCMRIVSQTCKVTKCYSVTDIKTGTCIKMNVYDYEYY
jgi:hypothetical protein